MSDIKTMEDYTPEKIILEVSKLVLENPYINNFRVLKNVYPGEIPSITIEIELCESKEGK